MGTTTIERIGESQELLSGASSFEGGSEARVSELVNPAAVSFETSMGCGRSLPVRPLRSTQDPTARSYPWLDATFEVLVAEPVNGTATWNHEGEKQNQADLASQAKPGIPEGVGS